MQSHCKLAQLLAAVVSLFLMLGLLLIHFNMLILTTCSASLAKQKKLARGMITAGRGRSRVMCNHITSHKLVCSHRVIVVGRDL